MSMKGIFLVLVSIIAVTILTLIAIWNSVPTLLVWFIVTILGIISGSYVMKKIGKRWKKIISVVMLAVFLPLILVVLGEYSIVMYLHNKGNILSSTGRYAEAIEYYDRAIDIYSDYTAWYKKGNVLFSMRRHEEAIECYDKVIEMNPNYANAWYSKGNALRD